MRTLTILILIATLSCHSCNEEEADPCAGVLCNEREECTDGSCVCLPGYGGDNCSVAQVPRSITIRKIEVLDWPATRPDSTDWDEGSAPDIFLFIDKVTTNETIFSSLLTENADQAIIYSTRIRLTDLASEYFLVLAEYDGEAAPTEIMDAVRVDFAVLATTQDFPEMATIDLRADNGMHLMLELTYQH